MWIKKLVAITLTVFAVVVTLLTVVAIINY